MADQENESAAEEVRREPLNQTEIPISRVKKIMKKDKDVSKINSEEAFLVAQSTEEVPRQPLNQTEIPISRVKKIMKKDKDVSKINSEAAFLVAQSTDLFLQFLAEISAGVALEKKKKTINLDHMRVAVKRHQPTSDFLLDSLPLPAQPSEQISKEQSAEPKPVKPAPAGTRRIDTFFDKSN